MTTPTKIATVTNLRNARKEQAAAKKAPAKKAPAKTAASRTPRTDTATETSTERTAKLRWTLAQPKVDGAPVEQSATVDDRTYTIERSGDAWRAVVKQGRKTTVLVESGTFGKAYTACTVHNREAGAK